ncbi:MAG TPA: hypothetical protein VF030_10635 [Solirubrobacterales bacterium]
MKARSWGFLVCALVALLALPAGAGAKPGYVVKPKSLRLSLGLPASNGYSATITTEGHRQVSIQVFKGSLSATYTALGRVSRKGIEADFGDFGRVSLRFKSKSRFTPRGPLAGLPLPDSLRQECRGKKAVGERGMFEGSVSFEGERGYTKIDARRLKGKVLRRYKRVCDRPFDPISKLKIRQKAVAYSAKAQSLGVLRFLIGVKFSLALGGEETTTTIAFGGERKKVGRVGVNKLLFVFDEVDSIKASAPGKQPVTAVVKLQKPFAGTATYLKEGKAPATWTGDLRARLPGSGLVALAGPEFQAEICRASGEDALEQCFAKVLATSALAQGSGSHSQPLALARLSSLR